MTAEHLRFLLENERDTQPLFRNGHVVRESNGAWADSLLHASGETDSCQKPREAESEAPLSVVSSAA